MKKNALRDAAMSQMPHVSVTVAKGTYRWNVIDTLPAHGNVGVELGVAAGSFSARMVHSGCFSRFYGVDVYGDNHNVAEYKKALQTVGLDHNYHLLRMRFDEALDLFPDQHFDFIYVDGYAHTGEEGGRTLVDWYAKLKPGGVMAGDDYDLESWPLVVWAVHHLVAQVGADLNVTDLVADAAFNRYRSWFFTKPANAPPDLQQPDADLIELGELAKLHRAQEQRKRVARRKRLKDSLPRES